MLSQTHRLSRLDFNLVKRTGHKKYYPLFLIYHLPHPSLKTSVVVSKKISKKATVRNQLRRQIYQHLADYYQNLNQSLIIYPQKYEISPSDLDPILSALS